MGEVLFWTLRKCLGNDEFDDKTHFIWIKILSRILKHMVPVAVAYELNTKSINQKARIDKIPLFHSQDVDICPSISHDVDKSSCSSYHLNDIEADSKVKEMVRRYSQSNGCLLGYSNEN